MNKAVVFYSLQGNSALAAKALAEKLGARLVELRERKPRSLKPMGFVRAGFQAAMGIRSKLEGEPWREASDCAELHVITPIWASKPVPAVNAFLAACDLAGKQVTLYAVQADPDNAAARAHGVMTATVQRKGGTVKAAHTLTGAAPGKGVEEGLAQMICALQ